MLKRTIEKTVNTPAYAAHHGALGPSFGGNDSYW